MPFHAACCRLRHLLLALALSGSGAASAAADQGLDTFLSTSVPICIKAPAVQCVDRGFAYADKDRSRTLSLEEAKATQAELNAWTKANAKRLPPQDREKLIVGLLVIQTVGPEQLFASYDKDGDGELTRDEVTADVKLDKRPLPEVLADPAAIDWESLATRAGEAAPLLKRLFQL